jgi:hypothetical protein
MPASAYRPSSVNRSCRLLLGDSTSTTSATSADSCHMTLRGAPGRSTVMSGMALPPGTRSPISRITRQPGGMADRSAVRISSASS